MKNLIDLLKEEFESVTELNGTIICQDEMLMGDDIVHATIKEDLIYLTNTRTKHTWLFN